MFATIWTKIVSWLSALVITVCSLLGITLKPKRVLPTEMITYNDAHTAVIITLDENPSTGYMWRYSYSEKDVVSLQRDDFVSSASGNLAGAGGRRMLTFAAEKEGTTTLTLDYLRSWEKDVPPIRTVTIALTVDANQTIRAQLIADTAS